MLKRVRAAVVGDPAVGKTSLIIAACSNIVREDTISVLPETNLSHLVERDDVQFSCLDTPSDPALLDATKTAVVSAHVVLICFSCCMPGTLENAVTIWFASVKKWNSQAAVLLVACKDDVQLPTEEQKAVLDRIARSEACILGVCTSTALSKPSASGVLTQACDAVLYPMRPLYDHVHQRLRSRARKAFRRIFQLCDVDGDGALSDQELSDFQLICYSTPFEPGQIDGIKQVVMQSVPNGVTTAGLTLEGFLHLQSLTIFKSCLVVCWTMLHRFGYNQKLELSEELFQSAPPRMCCELVSQLSQEAVGFLTATFNRCAGGGDTVPRAVLLTHSADGSGLLQNAPGPASPLDERDLGGCLVPLAGEGRLGLDGFLALWAYCTLVDPRQAVKAMLYIGYRDNMLSKQGGVVGSTAVKNLLVVAPRRPTLSEPFAPPMPPALGLRVVNCLVFGTEGCGKSTLLQRLARRRPGEPLPVASAIPSLTAAAVLEGAPDAASPPTVLVLIEVPEADARAALLQAGVSAERRARLSCHHAAFFCFDCRQPASLEAARAFVVAFSDLTGNVVPVALVACKSDLGMSPSVASQLQRDREQLELAPAIACDALHGDCREALLGMAAVATHPRQHIAVTPTMAAARQQRELLWRALKIAGLASAAVLSVSLLIFWGCRGGDRQVDVLCKAEADAVAGAPTAAGNGGDGRGGASSPALESAGQQRRVHSHSDCPAVELPREPVPAGAGATEWWEGMSKWFRRSDA